MAEESESSRERALSALAFLLLAFGLAALLQTWGFLRVTHATSARVVARSENTFGILQHSHQTPHGPFAVDNHQGTSLPLERHREVPSPSSDEIAKMLQETKAANKQVQSGYGSILEALKTLQQQTSYAKPEKCDSPRKLVLDRCICPAGSKWDGSTCAQSLDEMSFYMYRAQNDHNYVMGNVDMADLAGVMYYLHHEIVKINATPGVRMNGITRILRFLVTVRPSNQLVRQMKAFMPFVAFDLGKCSVPGCNKLWDHYGFAVGCQKQGASTGFAYTSSNDPSGAWFSLPAACPALPIGKKDEACMTQYPGGRCDDLSVSSSCTYSTDFAGEVFLDDLAGINNYAKWQREGHLEYDPLKDKGVGTSFWNFRGSTAWCERRMQRVRSLFKERYPLLPEDLPAPACF
ncbi:unnamed protein product [Durusdinium trenchii]|uniref:Uncharacterized protein n=2 Tax=Durusdinium trenchii TaxID=1381693 RepID=A0ABP0KYI2_9DINO